MVRVLILRLVTAVALAGATAAVRADAGKGGDAFDTHCAECHSVSSKLKNKKGPTLFGVVGRQSATVGDYQYSDAMKAAGYAWTPDKLDGYLASPKQFLPGGKMKFDGIADAVERRDLIEFLSQQK